MSCEKCDSEPLVGAFYRWKHANIQIIACEQHWKEIREVLNEAQKESLPLKFKPGNL